MDFLLFLWTSRMIGTMTTKEQEPPAFERARTLAHRYGCSVALLYKMCRGGRLAHRRVGRRILIAAADAKKVFEGDDVG
jgi:hypothetical protein